MNIITRVVSAIGSLFCKVFSISNDFENVDISKYPDVEVISPEEHDFRLRELEIQGRTKNTTKDFICFAQGDTSRNYDHEYFDEIRTLGPNLAILTFAVKSTFVIPNKVGLHPYYVEQTPDTPDETKGYTIHIGNSEYSHAIIIQSTDRSMVSKIHNEVLEKYEKTGSVEKAIEWLLDESQYVGLFKSRTAV